MSRDHRPKKILVVRLDRIGDVLLSTPAIKALRGAYPDSRLAMMVRPYALDIVKGNPHLDEVIIYDKGGSQRGLAGNLKFIQRLRKERFDIAIILHPTARTHLITSLAGIPVRIGYDRKWGFLLTKRIPHLKQFGLKHEIDYTLDLVRYLGVEPKDRALCMPIDEECERRINKIFVDNGIRDADRVVVINPGASCPSKRWSAERFAKVADILAERFDVKIVLISDSKDKVFSDRVAALAERGCVNLSGRTSVGDLASVFRRSKLLISNDSGPVHIACAVGTPVIAIFGRSDRGLSPERWGPIGTRDVVLHKYVGCRQCLAHNCEAGFKCLEAITIDEVVRSAERLLG